MTALHPVRPAPPPGTDDFPRGGVLPGADLLTAVLAGTADDEQPVTHVHRLPVRDSNTRPWPDWVSAPLRALIESPSQRGHR